MKCGFCGKEFNEEEGIKSCGKCGNPAGCRSVRCPACGYENPPEPELLKLLKKYISKS